MKRSKTAGLAVLILMAAFAANAFAAADKEVRKTFDKPKEIRFKLVLGDCLIQPSGDGKIHVDLAYSYAKGDYEPILEARSNYLLFQEKFHETNAKGFSRWIVSVPEGVPIDFDSVAGNITVSGLTVDIKGSTARGEINIEKAKGNIRLATGTGRVDVLESEGDFEVATGTGRVTVRDFKGSICAESGTGDVDARDFTLEGQGEFSSGTGNVEVVFPSGEDFDLSVNSGPRNAILKMNGRPMQGFFEFGCQAKRGRIICSEKFDKEEEYTENGTKHLLKSFTRSKGTPRISVKTLTGRAELVK